MFLPFYVPQGRYPLGQGGGQVGDGLGFLIPIPTPALPLKGREQTYRKDLQ